MRAASPDPAEDAEIQRDFFESNSAAYADLRDRGLLPPKGENLGSQDINEYLLKGDSPTHGIDPDASSTAVGANGILLGGGWDELLRNELDKPYWSKLLEFITNEHENYDVYPPLAQTFRAFELTPYDDVKVVILGQDPYPNPGEAHGLAFSVPIDVSWKPESLKNIRQPRRVGGAGRTAAEHRSHGAGRQRDGPQGPSAAWMGRPRVVDVHRGGHQSG
jgi:hypothetical protein